eukprot:2595615-Alexandrium_andersonii.AAC.1
MVPGAGSVLSRTARRRLLRHAARRRGHVATAAAPAPPPPAWTVAGAVAAAILNQQAALWRLGARALDAFGGARGEVEDCAPPPWAPVSALPGSWWARGCGEQRAGRCSGGPPRSRVSAGRPSGE